MRGKAGVLIITLVLFGGCLAAPEETESASTAPEGSAVFDELGAQVTTLAAPPSKETWFVATVVASPETGLSSFEWTVPAGALVPWAYNDDFDADEYVVPFEVALLARGADVTMWGLVTFEEMDGFVVPGAGHAQFPMTMTPYGTPMGTMAMPTVWPEYSTAPAFMTLHDVEENETVRFVLFAQAATSTEVGIAFRLLDHDPTDGEAEAEPAESAEAFLAARGQEPPVALSALASGKGLALHAYSDILFGGLTPGPGYGIELTAGSPAYAWNLPPDARATGGVHTLVASAEGTFGHGYTFAWASSFSWGYGATSFAVSATAYNAAAETSGASPDAWVTFMTPVDLTPYADALAAGDGDGPSSATLQIERVYVPGLVAAVSVAVIELGATLEELLGKPAPAMAMADDSGVLPVPAWMRDPRAPPAPGTPAFRFWPELRQA